MATESDILKEMTQASDERLRSLESDLAFERRYNADLRAKLVASGGKVAPDSNGQSPAVTPKGNLTDNIYAVLSEHPGTMRPRDIAEAVEKRGVTTRSKKGLLPMVLSTLGRRKDLFDKPERGLYRLKK